MIAQAIYQIIWRRVFLPYTCRPIPVYQRRSWCSVFLPVLAVSVDFS